MTSLSRDSRPDSTSTKLLLRILERPGLVAAVRELPGAVLGKLIDRIGLEDAGELVALASTAQLERVFDDDLWRAERAGGDETFRPERFALWLRVMLEAGEDAPGAAALRAAAGAGGAGGASAGAGAGHGRARGAVASRGRGGGGARARAARRPSFEEWEEFRLIARDPDAWDDVWGALVSLDREHHDRLRAILEQCCAMSTEYISGQGGLFQVLTADEMLDSDVAAARDDRRGRGRVHQPGGRAGVSRARAAGRRRRGARSDHARVFSRARPRRKRRRRRARRRRAVDAAAGAATAAAADARDLAALLRRGGGDRAAAGAALALPARTGGRGGEAAPGGAALRAGDERPAAARSRAVLRARARARLSGQRLDRGRRARGATSPSGRGAGDGARDVRGGDAAAARGGTGVRPRQALAVLGATPADVAVSPGLPRVGRALRALKRDPSRWRNAGR